MSLRSFSLRGAALTTALAGAAVATLLGASPASAATSNIDHVESADGKLQLIVSMSDLAEGESPDLDTVGVTFDGEPVPAEVQPLSEAPEAVRRTAVLAMDVSKSMSGEKFEGAKKAAEAFLDKVPEDVFVGLVTFADDVTVAHEPTRDTDAVREVLSSLELTKETRLYDGVLGAIDVGGTEGARSLLVLSDGRDTSDTSLEAVTEEVEASGVHLDVVALAQGDKDTALLEQLAEAGSGQVLSADDPEALSEVFSQEAAVLAQQLLVTVTPPPDFGGQEGTIAVTLEAGGLTTSDEAFVALPQSQEQVGGGELGSELEPVEPGMMIPQGYMYAGIGAATVGVLLILILLLGGSGEKKADALDRRIEAYTRSGAKKLAAANREAENSSNSTMTQQAVAVAESVLEGQKGLEVALGGRLEAAGLALKPAEWLLIHFGVALGFGVISLLLGGGNLLFMLLGLFFGLVTPWLFLAIKRKRRLSAFTNQLADTLQLMAGSLSAGLSLAQSVDTVVREGTDPMAAEFRRALVESRLGIEIEEALNGVATRMQSVDFEWVVMAIRIQREVGGNLSELLNKVAETIREREYLQRQVKTLSAEGRLSVWILGGLPPGFMLYLGMANPTYLQPMFSSPLGWAMLTVMGVLLAGGIFWMKKVVKVEV
jgi:tight adherence protein B